MSRGRAAAAVGTTAGRRHRRCCQALQKARGRTAALSGAVRCGSSAHHGGGGARAEPTAACACWHAAEAATGGHQREVGAPPRRPSGDAGAALRAPHARTQAQATGRSRCRSPPHGGRAGGACERLLLPLLLQVVLNTCTGAPTSDRAPTAPACDDGAKGCGVRSCTAMHRAKEARELPAATAACCCATTPAATGRRGCSRR